jgi:hypothetical protein
VTRSWLAAPAVLFTMGGMCALLLVLMSLLTMLPAQETRRPNIVHIIADDSATTSCPALVAATSTRSISIGWRPKARA